MSTTQKNIDDITRTKTSVDGTERIPARDSSGDFKITVANFQASLTAPSTYFTDENYTVLDDDNYERIEVDTTSGDITITLPLKANNLKRRIEIANVKGGTNKVIIAPNATDANKLSGDGLAAIWLPKVGNFVAFQESANSGMWEIVNERITSQLRLNTYAGYGSTDNKIMRFTNVVENVGNMFSENHSTGYNSNTEGLEITINRSGWYSNIFYTPSSSGATMFFGLSLNSVNLTTGFSTITVNEKISHAAVGSGGFSGSGSATMFFKKNDIIRPHTSGETVLAPTGSLFACTYSGQ